ncbi:hypothetical protein KCO_02867 [Pectobacterium brasiliense ICMP 19477]|nr:hypothetical protein KCO_02867 [Pectobacterium brasiliense ICMP 19477]
MFYPLFVVEYQRKQKVSRGFRVTQDGIKDTAGVDPPANKIIILGV